MSTANVLDKLIQTVMMQMFNKDCPPTCHNRTCNSQIYQKPRERKKRRRHCKKQRCPSEGVASIVCVTRCMKKCRRTPKTKSSDPRRPKTKSRCVQITCCSSRASDCSNSEPKYCSKCGQPLSGSTARGTILSQKNSPNVPRLNRKIRSNVHVTGSTSPEETCCATQTTCTPCQNGPSVQSHKTMVGCVPQFGPPYFLKNVEEHKDSCGNTFGIGLNGVEKQKECTMQVTCCESRTARASSGDFSNNCLPLDNVKKINLPATVHIRKCGKNIVTLRCGVDSDFDLRSITSDNVGRTYNKEQIGGKPIGRESQKAHRFIHIIEDQRSDNEGNCITKVRCADYSSITDESPRPKNTDCAPIKPDRAQRIRDLGYGPCSDLVSSAALPIKSNINIGYGPCCDRKTSALHINPSRGCNKKSHVMRMRFIKPCDNRVESPDYDSTCVSRPSCTCCIPSIPGSPVFRYDPCTDQYKDEFFDEPYHGVDDPQDMHLISQPPPPMYEKPYEYLPEQNRSASESSNASSFGSDRSEPPKGRYGYDFFYGSLKPR